ncbi:MAG: hypothetical protein A2Y40_03535 [Candidatus Margulisbacteria bacterium GWF2_35_9]|nr:MAG: hypothetical protein A2Y40_03535 [Candidatus Margulisbacteria bacterium GWF2_35_9]
MKYVRRRANNKLIESTALTDIVFLLLIFFLLTSSFVSHTGIKVNLPGINKPIETSVKKNISVSINDKEQVFLNDKLIEKASLLPLLKDILETDEEKIVIFRADKTLKIEKLIELMDIGNSAGAARLIIATKVQDAEDN